MAIFVTLLMTIASGFLAFIGIEIGGLLFIISLILLIWAIAANFQERTSSKTYGSSISSDDISDSGGRKKEYTWNPNDPSSHPHTSDEVAYWYDWMERQNEPRKDDD